MAGCRERRLCNCQCLPASLLLLLLTVLLCRTHGAFYRHQPPSLDHYYVKCDRHWCGEQWKRDSRILYYNRTVFYSIQNVTVVEVNNCSQATQGGTVTSTDCNSISTQQFTLTRIKHTNRTLTQVQKDSPYLSLCLINTDNIDVLGNSTSERYTLNRDKIWQIKVPKGCTLKIRFHTFDIEDTPNCRKDYLTVQTSKAEPNIHKYCGNVLTGVEVRHRRRVQLSFHSDDTITRGGILATFCYSNCPNGSRHFCSCVESSSVSKRMVLRATDSHGNHESTSKESERLHQKVSERKEEEEDGLDDSRLQHTTMEQKLNVHALEEDSYRKNT